MTRTLIVAILIVFISVVFTSANASADCRRETCRIFVKVSLSQQTMTLKIDNGVEVWPVATGKSGFETPAFDQHPDGRLYYNTALSNPESTQMVVTSFVVFIRGGYAIYALPVNGSARLGEPSTHGSIGLERHEAEAFFQIERSYGAKNTWVEVVP